jgi:elongation factor G
METGKIRNITLAGHNGSGKTSLAESLLYAAGANDRLGKTADGTTVCDFDAEEIKRKYTINTTLASFAYGENRVNVLDTPGLFDFAGGMHEAVTVGDTVMITVSAVGGVKTGTKKAYELAEKLGKPKMFVVTKIDDPNANFYNLLTDLKTVFGPTVFPIIVPVLTGSEITSFINLIEMKNYKYDAKGKAQEIDMPQSDFSGGSKLEEYRLDGLVAAVSEAVAETDDALMEKFFEGERFTQKELVDGIHHGMENGLITPVLCVSNATLAGVDMLLKEIGLLLPSPDETPAAKALTGTEEIEIKCDSTAPLSVFVFRTVADPFVGKMSFLKVMSGTLKSDSELTNVNTGQTEKISKLYRVMGKKQEEVTSASAGDIVVTTKINANTSETLAKPEFGNKMFKAVDFPRPCYSMAVHAKGQGDEAKMSAGVKKLLEEDLTLTFAQNTVTGELILSGLGEQHLEVSVSKLKTKFGADVELTVPRIAYRETIRKKVEVRGRHKKQSGGHGQFGDVVIQFEPCLGDELVFEEKVFGGAVPKNYFPAVEKGLQECMKKGVLAGCPVSGLKAILIDGSYHPVDSSEMAFKMAAAVAFKDGLKQADPIMLEPIGSLVVICPDDNTGDVMGELNKRRGRVLGMNPDRKGMTKIEADVPMREMHDFAMYIRQVAKGMGEFTFEFVRYEPLPAQLLTEVIASIDN